MRGAAVISLQSERRHGAMTPATRDVHLFESAPPRRVLQRLGLVRPGPGNLMMRAAVAALIAWLPLAVFAALQSVAEQPGDFSSFLMEAGVHARFLVAVPLLVFAETECATRLGIIIRHFVESGLVPENRRGRFDAAIAATRSLLESGRAEIAVIILAYVVVAGIHL